MTRREETRQDKTGFPIEQEGKLWFTLTDADFAYRGRQHRIEGSEAKTDGFAKAKVGTIYNDQSHYHGESDISLVRYLLSVTGS